MQKRLVTYLVLTFWVLSFSIVPLVADNFHPGSTRTMNSCPAPPPSGLILTDVTATTISVAWFSGSGSYYKIDAYDITDGYGLSPTYTNGSSATVNNLTPNHDYQISVSASYCPEGPYGTSAIIYATTGIIIVEGIVYVQNPCTPPQGGNTTIPGNVYTNCVAKSSNVAQPYTDAFIGRVTYQGAVLHFGMAWEQDTLHIGKVGNQGYASDNGYTFHQVSTESVVCRYNGTPMFAATFDASAIDIAAVDFSFMQQCTFSRCGAVSCDPGMMIDGGDDQPPGKKKLDTEANERGQFESNIDVVVAPNPFNESAKIQYALSEPAMVEIKLYDVLGKLVQTVQPMELLPAGSHVATVDGANLPDGVYFLTVQTGDKHKNHTLVKRE